MKKLVTAVVGLTAALAGSIAAAPANAATVNPDIIGGSKAPYTAWAVQLEFDNVNNPGGMYGCTGEQISAEWILTAQHCIQDISMMNVYFSNSTSNPGTPIAADDVMGSPYGDVALVHLSEAKYASSYAPLGDGYTARRGDSGKIMGYGNRAYGQRSSGLFQANISVLGTSTDAFGGNAIHIQGVDGASNHGDSGGPLMINGVIVGVCSTGDSADPGANTHAGSNYANLTDSRDWISENTGV